jgi:hypothetical protein
MTQAEAIEKMMSGSNIFLTGEPGMGYVALSRVRSLDGLYLVGMNHQSLEMNQQIAKYDKELKR